MGAFEFSRCALSVCVAAALLSACGRSSTPIGATGNATADNAISDIAPLKNHKAFDYTGKKQTFIVPTGVSRLAVIARGAQGGGFSLYPSGNTPGFPGRVYALIPVHAGQNLYIFVGGSGAHGGFNGGGAAGTSGTGYKGNSGGGASDIRAGGDRLKDRIIVAAGGGGAGEAINAYGFGYGGNGGGLSGQSGGSHGNYKDGAGGAGGTQSAGGSGGAGGSDSTSGDLVGQPGSNGALGPGGRGGNGGPLCYAAGGGGGGGGYYGGGGGGGGASANFDCYYAGQSGGGGGGSSYVEPSAITSRMWKGWKRKGDGHVIFSWN